MTMRRQRGGDHTPKLDKILTFLHAGNSPRRPLVSRAIVIKAREEDDWDLKQTPCRAADPRRASRIPMAVSNPALRQRVHVQSLCAALETINFKAGGVMRVGRPDSRDGVLKSGGWSFLDQSGYWSTLAKQFR
jgi:hypothetical protein